MPKPKSAEQLAYLKELKRDKAKPVTSHLLYRQMRAEEKYIAFGNELFNLKKFTFNDVKELTKKYGITNSAITYFKNIGYIKKISSAKYEATMVIMTPKMAKMLREEFSKYRKPHPAKTEKPILSHKQIKMNTRIKMNAELTEEKYIAFGNELFDLHKFTNQDIRNLVKKYRISNSTITHFKKLGYVKKTGYAKYESVSVIMTPQMVEMVRKESGKESRTKPVPLKAERSPAQKEHARKLGEKASERFRGKSLNIEHLKNSNKMETIGVRLQGQEKYKLAQSAGLIGLTLSEYCGNLILAGQKDNVFDLALKELNDKLSIENTNLKSRLLSAEKIVAELVTGLEMPKPSEIPKPSDMPISAVKPKLKIDFMTSVFIPFLIIVFGVMFGVTLGGIILKFLFF